MSETRVPAPPLFARPATTATANMRSGVRAGEAGAKAAELKAKMGD